MACEGESSIVISKEVCNMLKEDINYKLRHILQVNNVFMTLYLVALSNNLVNKILMFLGCSNQSKNLWKKYY